MEAKIEYTQDANGKYTSITVDGKKVRPGDLRGWNKAVKTDYFVLYPNSDYAENPFSGVMVYLNPLELSIYKWCVRWYRQYERGIVTPPIQTYDDMKYFLMHLNSDAYMDLLD